MSALALRRPTLHLPHLSLDPLRRRLEDARATWRAATLAEAGERSILDDLAPDWTEQTKDTYTVAADGHEHHCRTLLIRDWPPRVNAGWLAPLLFELGGDVSVALHTERLAKGAAAKRARNARVVQTTDALARAEAGKLSDPATQLNVASAEQIALDVEAGAEALYSCTVALTLRAPTPAELDALVGRVREHLAAAGVRVSPALWEQRAGFLSTLNYAGPSLERPRTVDTSTLALSWPFLSQELGTRGGPLVGIALADRAPVHLDLWAREEGWNAPGLCFIGPPGCVSGATLIDGPAGERPVRQLAAEGNPIRVWSLALDGSTVAAWATPPYRKGRAALYRFVLADGRRITVTDGHRFLTPQGWRHAGSLDVGARIAVGAVSPAKRARCAPGAREKAVAAAVDFRPLSEPDRSASILAPDPSTRAVGVQHLSQRRRDYRDGCSSGCRLGDVRPPLGAGSALTALPLLSGAPRRNRTSLRRDGLDNADRYSLLRTLFRRAKKNSPGRTPHLRMSEADQHDEYDCEASLYYNQEARQSRSDASLTLLAEQQFPSRAQDVLASPHISTRLSYSTIVRRTYVGVDEFYDLHVPIYENYLAQGIWHHNSGKTVTIGTLAARHLTQDEPPDVLLVDPMKGDYRRLVRELGGQIVRLSTSPEVVCNPLDLPPATILSGTGESSQQNPVTEQTRLVTGLLALMVTDPGPDGTPGRMTRAERAVAEGAVLAAYAGAGILPDDAATWDATPADVPTLPDVLCQLERQAAENGSTTARSLVERLAPFCRGTLAALFSQRTTLRLDAGLTSFDLEGLDSELRPLAVWLIGDYVWKVAKRDRRRRILSMDEVKTLLEYPESARLVAHLYTLGRAYHLSVWSATQLLSDYGSTPEGERALQSADTVLLLRQAPGRGSGDAQDRYGLTGADRAWLEAAPQGAGVLRTPKGTGRVQVTPSPLELALMGGPAAA